MTDCYLPRLGGIEVQVSDLVAAQRAAGHQVEVATATTGPDLAGVHRIAVPLPFDLPVHPLGGARITSLLAARLPDVVHVHVGAVSPFGWQGVRAADRAGLPTVVTVHSMWDPVTRGIYAALRTTFDWHRWGLVVTAVSTAAAAGVRAVAGQDVPVHVVANGLDVPRWRPTCPAGGGDGAVHIVAVGRLAPRKQPVPLLRLLLAARDRVPDEVAMRATIVGDGPARRSMERFAAAHGLASWVAMPGRCSRDQVAEILAGGDVFVAPAPRESFGIAALEARAAGLPIVARTESGVGDFVRHGTEGLLAGTFDDMAAALALLCTDRALRERIARHNHTVPPTVGTWPTVLADTARCYAQARHRLSDTTTPDRRAG
ncbi:Glycosyltransferase involved in cell wall bisynthesis [Actinokineospora alba]|uniref:Glycosyltransferase involved in cell wall bisynthesis n=1 Tax=Actinokineospora alba TaxID=504798 RepID=A0A1H0UII5_9PSEU|nr:glycosyltransferase family 4 protein [Actinokineospora alba]TDP65067.1 glycosyltransferase involved in cell wall biosynthesis [Actinokineospora alba]SDH53301.1 Glycosyltransferase involved in cell wall bisynthesis [Actinokineospora alba]SDP65845.1 Glycosyltransferase involved in cell wall bisynthesis [Actinokineospora alba]